MGGHLKSTRLPRSCSSVFLAVVVVVYNAPSPQSILVDEL